MKLEVGMYARYNGKIGKITHICKCEQCEARGYYEPVIEYIHGEDEYVSCYFKNNLKASHNIIDLIEVGDYVNGYRVITNKKEYIELNNADLNYDCIEYQRILKNKYSEIAINSIVTKEQFESMSYKVN